MIHIFDSNIRLSDGLQDALREHMIKSVPAALRNKEHHPPVKRRFPSPTKKQAVIRRQARAEQRAAILAEAYSRRQDGQPITQICREMRISPKTVYAADREFS